MPRTVDIPASTVATLLSGQPAPIKVTVTKLPEHILGANVLAGVNSLGVNRLAEIQAKLSAAGIDDISKLGQISFSGAQSWTGGNMLRPDVHLEVIPDVITFVPHLDLATTVPPIVLPRRRTMRRRALRSSTPLVDIEDFLIAADEIVLAADLDAVIRVPGRATLVANKITVENGPRITWQPVNLSPDFDDPGGYSSRASDGSEGAGSTWSASGPPASLRGGHGGNGQQGHSGNDGPDAPELEIVVGDMNQMPQIVLAGHRGGAGGRGQDGGNGGKGGHGAKAKCVSVVGVGLWRKRGPGWGGQGGNGGNAGCGGVGGKGGDGGDVSIWCPEEVRDRITTGVDMRLEPGAGGPGGPPGNPGSGGSGGNQGQMCGPPETFHRTGPPGNAGLACTLPPEDLEGPQGDNYGELKINIVTKEYIVETFNKPAITNFDPLEPYPGGIVELFGTNIPVGVSVKLGDSGVIVALNRDDDKGGNFILPKSIMGGELSVALVDQGGTVISNLAALIVHPLVEQIDGVGRWGSSIEIHGAGFQTAARVQVDGDTFEATYLDSERLDLELPLPGGAFEQHSEDRSVRVVNPDGYESNDVTLHFEPWLHLGFDPRRDAFKFNNSSNELDAVPDSIIDLDLFEQTFGEDDMDTLAPDDIAAIAGAVIDPASTGMGWLFYVAYKEFLKSRPGVCSGWSALALDHFFRGGPSLIDQYSHMTELPRDLFATQGRVLSGDILTHGVSRVIQGDDANADFLNKVEAGIRRFLPGSGDSNPRQNYPLANFLAKPGTDIVKFWGKISEQHIIIPYAIRWPEEGDQFLARVYCCNNYTERFVRIDLRSADGTVKFRAREFNGDLNAGDDPYDVQADYKDLDPYRSGNDWIVAHLPMKLALYDDVDIPTEILGVLSPVSVIIDDGAGHVLGDGSGGLFDAPDVVVPHPWLPGFFSVGNVDRLTLILQGLRGGEYRVGYFDMERGFAAFADDIATRRYQKDEIQIDLQGQTLEIKAGGDKPTARLWTSFRSVDGTRRASLREHDLKVGSSARISTPHDAEVGISPANRRTARLTMSVKPWNRSPKSARVGLDKTQLRAGAMRGGSGQVPKWEDIEKLEQGTYDLDEGKPIRVERRVVIESEKIPEGEPIRVPLSMPHTSRERSSGSSSTTRGGG